MQFAALSSGFRSLVNSISSLYSPMVAAWFSPLSLLLQQWEKQPVAGQPPPPSSLLLQHQDHSDKSARALCCIFKLAARCAACLVITHAGEGGGRGGGRGVYALQARYGSALAARELRRRAGEVGGRQEETGPRLIGTCDPGRR